MSFQVVELCMGVSSQGGLKHLKKTAKNQKIVSSVPGYGRYFKYFQKPFLLISLQVQILNGQKFLLWPHEAHSFTF